MKIRFWDVGREKWGGKIEIPFTDNPDDIAEYAYRQAKKILATKYPETEYNAETNAGEITAGYRCVGKFEVVK